MSNEKAFFVRQSIDDISITIQAGRVPVIPIRNPTDPHLEAAIALNFFRSGCNAVQFVMPTGLVASTKEGCLKAIETTLGNAALEGESFSSNPSYTDRHDESVRPPTNIFRVDWRKR